MPVNGTASGEPAPVWVTSRLAARAPVAVGRKSTATVVDWPGPSTTGVPSVNRSANRPASAPVIAVDERVTDPDVPTLVSVTSRLAVWRTGVSAKSTGDGEAANHGGTSPPVTATSRALTLGLPTPGTNATSTVPSDTAGAASTRPRPAPARANTSTSRNAVAPSTSTSNTRPPTTWDGSCISAR